MNTIPTNRINSSVAIIPRRYFLLSIVLLLTALAAFLSTGFLFKFEDEFSTGTVFSQNDLKNNVLSLSNCSPAFLKNYPGGRCIGLIIVSGSPYDLGPGCHSFVDKKRGIVAVSLNKQQLQQIHQKLQASPLLKIKLSYWGIQKNLFQRVMADNKGLTRTR